MIEKNIRLQPHHARDLLVGRRSDGQRPGYQPPGHRDAPAPSRGGPPGGGDRQMTYTAPAPVTTAVAPPSILSKPANVITTAPLTRDVMPIVPTATKRPTEMLDIAGDIKAQQKLQEDIQESQRTGAYAKELGLPPKTIDIPKLNNIVDLGDDAKTRQVQLIQKKADLSWQNKSTREKEEQQEKWDTAESKIKLQKEGGFWKSLGNIAMAMVLPALLPAKLAKGYNLYKTVKNASAFAKKHNLFSSDQDAVQYVKKMIGGKDLSSLVAGKENVIAKNMATFSGEGANSNKEYTEDTIGKVKTVGDIGDSITNEEKQKYRSQLDYMQGILQSGYYTNRQGETIQLTDDHRRQLSDYMNRINTYLNPTTQGIAHGGLIDQPFTGRSRYI